MNFINLSKLSACFLLFSIALKGQSSVQDSTRGVDAYNEAYQILVAGGDRSKATELLGEAALLLEPTKNDSLFIASQNIFSFLYQDDFKKYEEQVYKSYKLAKERIESDSSSFKSIALNNYGTLQIRKGNYTEGIDAFEQCIAVFKALGQNSDEINAIRNLSICHQLKGDLDKAKDVNAQLQLRIKALYPENYETRKQFTSAKSSIGYIQQLSGEMEKAINNYKEALNINQSMNEGNRRSSQILRNIHDLTRIYIKQNKLDEAKEILNQGLLLKGLNNKYAHRATYNFLGSIDLMNDKLQSAETNFNKGLEITLKQYEGYPTSRWLSEPYFNLAELHLKRNNYKEALSNNQKALNALANDFTASDWEILPDANDFIDYNKGLITLAQKGEILNAYGKVKEDPIILDFGLKSYLKLDSLMNLAKENTMRADSKIKLSEISNPALEDALELCYALFEQTKDDKYIDLAFDINESLKGSTLLSEIDQSQAMLSKNIPESTREEIDSLKRIIADFERGINRYRDIDTTRSATLKRLKIQNRATLDQLMLEVEKEIPALSDFKNISNKVHLSAFQNKLKGETVLQYFYGEESIYILAFNKSKKAFIKVEQPSINKNLTAYIDYINTPPGAMEMDEQFQMQKGAYNLAGQLFLSPLNQLGNQSKHIIIISDGLLSYLPFEALVIQEPTSGASFEMHYALQDYNIQYLYSTRLYNYKNPNSETRKQFLGLAPSFQKRAISSARACSGDELYALECNEEEVKDINELFSGQAITGANASKQYFIDEADQYQILHLATHVCVDEQNPRYSQIFFKDDFVSNSEIQSMRLNADLAVLSACNTGVGKLTKGEGVLSLSRDFIYAGCNAVITSLWAVDDCSTSELMRLNYLNLKERQNKTQALSNAKRTYFEQTDNAKTHPYYWAPFVLVGNDDALEIVNANFKLWPFLIAGLLLFFVAIFIIKKK